MGRITRLFLVLAAAIALVAAPAIGQVRGQSEQEKEEFMRKAREEQERIRAEADERRAAMEERAKERRREMEEKGEEASDDAEAAKERMQKYWADRKKKAGKKAPPRRATRTRRRKGDGDESVTELPFAGEEAAVA